MFPVMSFADTVDPGKLFLKIIITAVRQSPRQCEVNVKTPVPEDRRKYDLNSQGSVSVESSVADAPVGSRIRSTNKA